jgi:anaerobic selenocysteine-containing dehydrogenase
MGWPGPAPPPTIPAPNTCTPGNSAGGWVNSSRLRSGYRPSRPDEEYPLILTTGRVLYHYHTGTMTRRSEGLDWAVPRGYVEVNNADAAAIDLLDGGQVQIISRRGQVRTQARVGDRVPPGVVFPLLPLEGGAGQPADPGPYAGPDRQNTGIQGQRRPAGEPESSPQKEEQNQRQLTTDATN